MHDGHTREQSSQGRPLRVDLICDPIFPARAALPIFLTVRSGLAQVGTDKMYEKGM